MTAAIVRFSEQMSHDELLDQFAEFDTPLVSDALDEAGIDGVLAGLPPVRPEYDAVGRARPIRIERVEDTDQVNFPSEMLTQFRADEFLVIASGTDDLSCWGGMASRLAAREGVRAALIDGGFRDVPQIRRGSFPVFGRKPTPKTGQGRLRVVSTSDPVTIDDVEIHTDDVVVADATGVTVVPSGDAEVVLETARRIDDDESSLVSAIETGRGVAEIDDEFDHF